MYTQPFPRGRRTLTILATGMLAIPAMASWLTNAQRVHSPIGKDASSVEITAVPGGYVYLATQINPLLFPQGANRRPVLVKTGPNLNATGGWGYMRPGENVSAYATELYLDSTDLARTADGGFIICGNYYEGGGLGGGYENGGFLLKVDALLSPTWFRQYPAGVPSAYVFDLQFKSVVETIQNGSPMYAVCGQITTNIYNQALVAAFDSVGNTLWAHELTATEGGYGVASEIIVYDAGSLAITGFAGGAPHVHCQNFQAYADVLVARFSNTGVPQFIGLYGQGTGVIAGNSVSFAETGASLTRPTNSPDLVIVGNVQAWATIDDCPGGASLDDMLAFRITPAGAVVWAYRYGLNQNVPPGYPISVSARQVKPVTAFVMIAANCWSTLNNVHSENIGFFRLMAGNGSLAAQTEIYGGMQQETASSVIPLGPPWPYAAVLFGTSTSYPSFGVFQKPLLIERMPSARRHCEDNEVSTRILPVILPEHGMYVTNPVFPMRTQPLEVWSMTVTDEVICARQLVGDLNGDGVIDFFDIDPFLLALFDPPGFGAAYPEVEILAADVNGDDVVDFFDIDPFLNCLFVGCP